MTSANSTTLVSNRDEGECVDFNEVYKDPTNTTTAMVLFAIIYGQIFFLGLVGNISMMFLTLRHRHLQTVQNIFILNLAMSDVLMCLLLSAIAIDRYNLVVRPHANLLRPRGAIFVAAILWTLSALVSLPYCYFMRLEYYPGYCGQFCTEHWPNQVARRGYALVLLCCQFLIPFAIMSCCYSAIFSRLKERANSKIKKLDERSQLLESTRIGNNEFEKNGTPVHSNFKEVSAEDKQKAQLLSNQRRVTTILASMVLIFGLSWLPQNVITLIIEYDDSILHSTNTNYTYIASSIAHCIAMTNNVFNPILYAWLNPSFKEILIHTFWGVMHSLRNAREESNSTGMQSAPHSVLGLSNSRPEAERLL